ncbi:unnamed protein product, partial [Chrysoparadoxa australica]
RTLHHDGKASENTAQAADDVDILISELGAPSAAGYSLNHQLLSWSNDGSHVAVSTSDGGIVCYARDGTELGSVEAPPLGLVGGGVAGV